MYDNEDDGAEDERAEDAACRFGPQCEMLRERPVYVSQTAAIGSWPQC